MGDPFWQKAILQVLGPLTAALVGTFVLTLAAGRITRRVQRRQEQHNLRLALVAEMAAAAAALYLETQRYWRSRDRELTPEDRKVDLRDALDEQYRASRVAGTVLEQRLKVLFATPRPWELWHSTMDLLTVRYFQLIDLVTPKLLELNARTDKEMHSGLTVEQLKNPKGVLDAYKLRIDEATRAVLEEPLVTLADAPNRKEP